MARRKGAPRDIGSGRKKGTPNKRSLVAEELLRGLQFDGLEEMVCLLRKPGTSEAIKAKLLAELAQYQYPKRKAIEHSGKIAGEVILIIEGA